MDSIFPVDPDEDVRDRTLAKDKAERLYRFFDNVEEVRKVLRFLDTMSPKIAREIINEL